MIRIDVKAAASVGLVTYQNGRPLLREAMIVNEGEEDLVDLTVSASAKPAFAAPVQWAVDRIAAGGELHLPLRRLEAQMLRNSEFDGREGERGELSFVVRRDGAELCSTLVPIRLLADAEWGGPVDMPELLASFSIPSDPAVDRLLRKASKALEVAEGGRIDGYASGDPRKVWSIAQAIWSAVVTEGLHYAPPPASWNSGQRVRSPSMIEEGGVATCLDTTMLFASVLEQAGLDPVVVVVEGHSLPGVWLRRQDAGVLLERDAGSVRKALAANDLRLFESTLATGASASGFGAAVEAGAKMVREDAKDGFSWMLDVHRARAQGIFPLKSIGMGKIKEESEAASVEWESAPELDIRFEVKDRAAVSGRIDRWQRKLLDLTARNRLLNVPQSSGKYLRILASDASRVEDLLASGAKLRMKPMPDLGVGGRDVDLFQEREHIDLPAALANASLDRKELLIQLDPTKVDAALVALYRQAKSDLREGGSNTLFLGIGSLVWRKQEKKESRIYRAPLILVPVKLERKSAASPYELVAHEDDTKFNLTLAEMLRQDFELELPGLEGELPRDGNGVDVALVQKIVRQAVRTTPGFEVADDVTLGIFSFAKYLMWKDLVDRQEDLKRSEVVRALVEKSVAASDAQISPFGAGDLDREIRPTDLYTPLPADSSQLAAVVASARGESFVMIGPPGTGKSQTIANMIAHNMALGRRVLFVAEKMAALEVVHRRLTEKGLGHFCLEVHSHKASKAEVVGQLDRAWSTAVDFKDREWERLGGDLSSERTRLNDYVRALHREHANGLTIHGAIGLAVRDRDKVIDLGWGDARHVDEDLLGDMRQAARRLGVAWRGVEDLEGFQSIWIEDWSNAWQVDVVQAARDVLHTLSALERAEGSVRRSLDAFGAGLSPSEGGRLARAINLSKEANLRVALHDEAERLFSVGSKVAEFSASLAAARAGLSTEYEIERLLEVDASALHEEWSRAAAKWFFSRRAKERVARDLKFKGGSTDLPDVERDVVVIRRVQGIVHSLDAYCAANADISLFEAWEGRETSATRVAAELERAKALHAGVGGSEVVRSILASNRQAWNVDPSELGRLDDLVQQARADFDRAVERYGKVVDINIAADDDREELRTEMQLVIDKATRLRDWCAWRAAVAKGEELGLGALVVAVESNVIPSDEVQRVFEASHARWFAAQAMDREPLLLESSRLHVDAGERFRRIDALMQDMTASLVAHRLSHGLPSRDGVAKSSGFGALKREVAKKRAHKPVRELISEMGDSFRQLAPCMLMSPISVAQHLPADSSSFDLVIFDEASQITSWDAVGAMARGAQVVVAGDPKQMPPTNYFSKGTSEEEEGEDGDLESILEECLMSGMRERSLDWHYRSRHESLIAFSNMRYYRGGLVTFPCPETRDSAVSFHNVQGQYVTGKRINVDEATFIADQVVDRLRDASFIARGWTIGVITMNTEQQALVENLLDERRQRHPEIERFWSDGLAEPVVVHNLESAQGDERDVVFLSFGFGPAVKGGSTMSMMMGALNKSGAQRRLNVAISRARTEMVVVTSFDPSMLNLNSTKSEAIRDLKDFLTFAQRGPAMLEAFDRGSLGGVESPFEEAVAEELGRRGWMFRSQVGVSRFRIDFGIVHPDRPGDYLAGVEADGAAYHSSATARDRDKVRAAILGQLGWNLVRVWSTDWWTDRQGAADRLHRELVDLYEASKSELVRPVVDAVISSPEVLDDLSRDAVAVSEIVGSGNGSVIEAEIGIENPDPAGDHGRYVVADLGDQSGNKNLVGSPGYASRLEEQARRIIEVEAPTSMMAVVGRLADAHGLRMTSNVSRHLRNAARRAGHVVKEGSQEFLWADESQKAGWSKGRFGEQNCGRRSCDVPAEEILAMARQVDGGDPSTLPRRILWALGCPADKAGKDRVASVLAGSPKRDRGEPADQHQGEDRDDLYHLIQSASAARIVEAKRQLPASLLRMHEPSRNGLDVGLEIDETTAGEDLELVSGVSCQISYVDANGDETVRDIVCHRLREGESGLYIDAFCMMRKRGRRFLVDRIGEMVDLVTGEIHADGHAFAAQYGLSRVEGPKSSWGLHRREFVELKASLVLLSAIARADGAFLSEEKALIEDFCRDYGEMRGVEGYNWSGAYLNAMRLIPSESLVKQAIETLTKRECTARSLLVGRATAVMDADGIRDDQEVKIVKAILKRLA